MSDPMVVITVLGGVAEIHHNDTGAEVEIFDFDDVEEYASQEQSGLADKLLEEGRYSELRDLIDEIKKA